MNMHPSPSALIVSNRNTLITRTGASEYLVSFAKSLRQAGFDVSIAFIEEMPERMARLGTIEDYDAPFSCYEFFRAVKIGNRFYSTNPSRWIALLLRVTGLARFLPKKSWYIGIEFKEPTPAALSWIGALMQELRPDLVIANYFNSAGAFEHAPKHAAKAILVHDILALRRESFEAAGLELDFELPQIQAEAARFKEADICFAIKDEEKAFIEKVAPHTAAVTMPVTTEIPATDLTAARGPVCIFVGDNNACNRDGLKWFLAEVWPLIIGARPDVRLHIAGRVGNIIPRPLPGGVTALGFVDDLAAAYAQACVAITPLRTGSGVKIKLIEGLSYGLPSVATSVGAEGIAPAPPEVLRIEDSAEGFATAVLDALAAPDAAGRRQAAREFAREHYDQSRVGADIIRGLVARGLIPSPAAAGAAG